MKAFVLTVGAILVVSGLAGCLEDISTGYNDLTEGWFVEDTALAATIAEIDAVSRLHSDSGKYEGFKAIAGRRTLRTQAQVHLVKPVFKNLYSESDKADVLLTLINNSSFSCACKLAILRRLDNLSSESGKMTILKAINQRGHFIGESKQKAKTNIFQSGCSSSKCRISPLAAEFKRKQIFTRAKPDKTIEIFGTGELDKQIYDAIVKADAELINSDEHKGKGVLIYRVRSEDGRLNEDRAHRTRTEFHWTGLGRGGHTPKRVDEGEIKVMYARDGQPAEFRVIHHDYHEFRRAVTFEKQKVIVWDDIFLKRVSPESSCTVKGTVLLENDANQEGIRVSGGGASATTDEEGNFVLKGLRSGQVRIGAGKSGYHGLYGEVNVNKGQTATCQLKGYRIRKAKVRWMYQPDGSKDFTNDNNVVAGTATLQDEELDRVSFAEGFKQVSGKSDFLMYQKEDVLILRNFDIGPGRPVINEIDKPFVDITEVGNLNNNRQSYILEAGKVYVLRCYDGEHYGKMEVLEIIDE